MDKSRESSLGRILRRVRFSQDQKHGRIRGRKYARTGIVAAQMGDAIIAPCQYSGTMNHELFEDWFENPSPALPPVPCIPSHTSFVPAPFYAPSFTAVCHG